jgi:hypothetical protein
MLRRVRLYLAVLGLVSLAACFIENIKGRSCTSDADCSDPSYSKCDTRFKTCVPQSFDLDMGTGGNDLTTIGCTMSSTCPASAPVCSPAQICSSCGATGMSTECNTFHTATVPPTPLCGPNGGCVECLTKDHCDAVHKTCDLTSNACVPCVNNADCSSGLCNAGVCADKTTLLYVNNALGAGCSDTGSGTFAMPFCHVQTGLNAAAMSSKQLVVFAGTYIENVQASTTLNGGNDYVATAVGVGTPIIKPSSTGAALIVAGTTAKQTTVSFDGFTFDGSTLADGSFGIDCQGMGAAYGKTLVTITRSLIKGASGTGLNAQTKCTLTLDADTFVSNKGGAIALNANDFTLTNLLIHDNGSSGSASGGIYLQVVGEAGKMTMFNLTVVNNTASGTAFASGIACAAAPTTLANTLILGNQGPAVEISPGCMPIYSAFIGGTTSTNEAIPVAGCGVPDLLQDPTNGNFHPKKGGTHPCTLVDQGFNTGAPTTDLDGTSRPQPTGGTDDIGCYEAK